MSRAALLLLVLASVVHADPQSSIVGTKWRIRADSEMARLVPTRVLPLSPEPPPRAEPTKSQTSARYATLTLGADTFFIAVTPHRLWVDRDRDGRFESDEGVPKLAPDGSPRFRVSVSLKIARGGGDQQVPLLFTLSGTKAARQLLFAHGLERYGDVELLGRVRRFVLRDDSFDLRFDHPRLDLLYLDVDGDGRLQSHKGSHERARILDGIRIGEAGFSCRPLGATALTVQFTRDDTVPPSGPRRLRRPELPLSGVVAPGGGDAESDRLLKTFDAQDIIEELGATGGESAVLALFALAIGQSNPTKIRTRAIAAMGYAQYARHSQFLKLLAGSTNKTAIRLAAMAALHASGAQNRSSVYEKFLHDRESPAVFAAAARYVGGLRPRMIVAALAELEDPVKRSIAYMAARAALSPELMLKLARARGEPLRANALRDLFLLDHEEAIDLAVAVVLEPNVSPELIHAAAMTLCSSGAPESIAVMFDLVLRGVAVPALEPLLVVERRERSVRAIAAQLKSKNDRVRLVALRILAEIPTAVASDAVADHAGKEKKSALVHALDRALLAHAHARTIAKLIRPIRRARDVDTMQSEIVRLVARGQRFAGVRQALVGLLEWRNLEARVLVLRALRPGPYPDLARASAKLLGNRAWQIRLSAAEALGRFRVNDGLEALVKRIEVEKQIRVQAAMGESLTALTGQKLGRYGALWKKWWDREGAGFVVPTHAPKRKRSRAKASGETKTVANFYGIPVTSNRVVFVLDRSGSMSSRMFTDNRTRLDHAKIQLERAVAAMPSSTRINVVFFGSGAAHWRSRLVGLNRSNRATLHKFLGGIDSRGGTEMYDALALALKDKEVETIYLLSDGSPTGKFSDARSMIREIGRLNLVRRVRIHCISLGRASPLLKTMAERNDGTYRRE